MLYCRKVLPLSTIGDLRERKSRLLVCLSLFDVYSLVVSSHFRIGYRYCTYRYLVPVRSIISFCTVPGTGTVPYSTGTKNYRVRTRTPSSNIEVEKRYHPNCANKLKVRTCNSLTDVQYSTVFGFDRKLSDEPYCR